MNTQIKSEVEKIFLTSIVCHWWEQFKQDPISKYPEISALLRGALSVSYQKNEPLVEELLTLFNVAGEIFFPNK